MKRDEAISFIWSGTAMIPKPAAMPFCVNHFERGEEYRLMVQEDRSVAFHKFFFAVLDTAFANLPEDLVARFPTKYKLRLWCLAYAGFSHDQTLTYRNEYEARLIYDYAVQREDDSHIQINGNEVQIFTPYSMSYASMHKEEFREAAEAIFDILSKMIGVDVTTLKKNADKAA